MQTSAQSITITYPNGGESWNVGNLREVTWTTTGLPADCHGVINYSYDDGNTWQMLVYGNISSFNGKYSFVVPDQMITGKAKIKIEAWAVNRSDVSDQSFEVNAAVNTVAITNPHEAYPAESTQPVIVYSDLPLNTALRMECSLDNGASWNLVKDYNQKSSRDTIFWTLSAVTAAKAKLRIRTQNEPSVAFETNVFSIVDNKPYIVINSPAKGQYFKRGTGCFIQWSTNMTQSQIYKLEYSVNGIDNWVVIDQGIEMTGSHYYHWDIPSNLAKTVNARIRISSDNGITALSKPFGIADVSKEVVITQPEEDFWQNSTLRHIALYSINVAYANLDYTANGGTTWNTIKHNVPGNTYYVSWLVPPSLIGEIQFRFSDVSDPSIATTTDPIQIIPAQDQLKFSTSMKGLTLYQGDLKNISWTLNFQTQASTILELSTDGGKNYESLYYFESGDSTAFYVPAVNSNQCKLRLRNYTESVAAESETFAIKPKFIELIEQTSAQYWPQGSSQIIQWNSYGVATVKIEYIVNNTAYFIGYANAANGEYPWAPIPFITDAKIRLSDATSDIKDESTYRINDSSGPSLTLNTYKNQGYLYAGALVKLNSGVNQVFFVNYLYSKDNGLNWTEIANRHPAQEAFVWTVPLFVQYPQNVIFKVEDADNVNLFDFSNQPSVITNAAPSIQQHSPQSWQSFVKGSPVELKWVSENLGEVELWYSINNGELNGYITTIPASVGEYTWTAPFVAGEKCEIIFKDANKNGEDIKTYNFGLVDKKSLELITPDGGENLVGGVPTLIRWKSAGVNDVKLSFSSDKGVSWKEIPRGYYYNNEMSWTVPYLSSSDYLVKVEDATDSTIYDQSENTFVVTAVTREIFLYEPGNGIPSWPGRIIDIKWETKNIKNLELYYTTDLGINWQYIDGVSVQNGSYAWEAPTVTSSRCLIKIVDYMDPTFMAISDTFAIGKKPTALGIVSPNGGEVLTAGTQHNIKWYTDYLPVKTSLVIDFSADGGTTYRSIDTVQVTYNDEPYLWQVPDTISSKCRIRIRTADGDFEDASNATFSIKAVPVSYINVTSPSANGVINAGNTHGITWETGLPVGTPFDILISYNGGGTFTLITTVTSSGLQNSYSWISTDTLSYTCKIMVRSHDNQSIAGETNNFTIYKDPVDPLCRISFSKEITGVTATFTSANVYPNASGVYKWNFGDGSVAGTQNASHNYKAPGLYPVSLTFVSADNVCEAAFYDTLVIASEECTVSFTKYTEGNKVSFVASSNSVNMGAYRWDFGDGVLVSGKTASHIYARPGTYKVTVSYTSANLLCKTSYFEEITINQLTLPIHQVNGRVMTGGQPLAEGKVSLFKYVADEYVFLQSASINASSNGTYNFANLEKGYYVIHAIPGPAVISNYLPTYLGNESQWLDADLVYLTKDSTVTDINLTAFVLKDNTWNTGTDTVQGFVSKVSGSDPAAVKRLMENSEPIENAVVYLYNSNGDLLATTTTDEYGRYEFTGIIAGNYTIKIEYAGTTESNSVGVLLDGNPATKEQAVSKVAKQAVVTGISEESITLNLNVFPNPSKDLVNIVVPVAIQENINVVLYDLSGKEVLNQTVAGNSSNTLSLNITAVGNGSYIGKLLKAGSKETLPYSFKVIISK